MVTFGRGQKGKLADLGCGSNVAVDVALQAPGVTIDLSCFGLDAQGKLSDDCLLYTSPSPRDRTRSRMPSSA